MKSIRRDLTIRLMAVTLLLGAACGAGLFAFVRARLLAEFDDALLAEARSISASVVVNRAGRTELDYVTGGGPDLGRTAYFEIRRNDGTVFRRSPSLGESDLPVIGARPGEPRFAPISLPCEKAGRAIAFRFQPHPDPDEEPAPAGGNTAPSGNTPPASYPEMTIVLAAERSGLDVTLRVLGSSLLLAAAALCVGTILAVVWTIRRGLRPLVRLADEADFIRDNSLHRRFSTDNLPAELRSITGRLNELLARLQQAFERERRFTADAAHELRTPIAELRSLAEVSLRWPQDASPVQNYRDVLDIARNMEAIVTALLEIARCESGARRAGAEALDLCQILREAWRPHEQMSRDRRLNVRWDLPSAAPVRSDRAMLLAMIGNLLSNAASYASCGGRVECRIRQEGETVELLLFNTCDDLHPEDLPHLFEPFWRKDAARSGGDHAGLGLALVYAYSRVLDTPVEIKLSASSDEFRVTLKLPREPVRAHGASPAATLAQSLQEAHP